MKSALVTGSSGFVGRHMCRELEERGYWVTRIDCADSDGSLVRDARAFFQTNSSHYNLTVHCAAVVGGRKGIERKPLDVAVNLELDAAYLRWATVTKPDQCVYLSSSAVYPIILQQTELDYRTPTQLRKLRESDVDLSSPQLPDASYGWAKLTGEMLTEWARAEGLHAYVFRPFSGYGSDQSLDYPFPTFIQRAVAHNEHFPIWGTGAQVRDWIHIDDVLGAIFAALNEDFTRPVNLCTGLPTSFNQLAYMCCKALGYTPNFMHLLDMPQGVMTRVGNSELLHTFYTPKIHIGQGIARALEGVVT